MRFSPAQDVIVDFDGKEHRGEVIKQTGGYVLATILTDPEWDYGSAMVAPVQTVCVRESRVKLAQA